LGLTGDVNIDGNLNVEETICAGSNFKVKGYIQLLPYDESTNQSHWWIY